MQFFLVPGVPRELTLSLSPSNSSEEIVVEWRSPAGGDAITSYLLQWIQLQHPTTAKFTKHISGQTNYSNAITNLDPTTTYNVRIVAINSAGWGNYTAFETITTGKKCFSGVVVN